MTTDLKTLDAWWRAANYLAVGQIYLMDNPLLREPLAPEHIKPRLLGHWGTTPGLTFLWAHLNRVITRDALRALYITGPGHGGPAVVATAWMEGTYSELYSQVPQDADGMKELFRQFSFPGGIPSHAAPETPGSIHEGGELGYSLAHAYGAAFDNPDLLVACVIGDGEAETGPLAAGRGRPTSSCTRCTTAPCCRSCTSTATRSPTPRCCPGSPATSCSSCCRGTDTAPSSSRAGSTARTPWPCTSGWPPRSTRSSPRSPASREHAARQLARANRSTAPAGPRWCCARRRAGPGPARSTACPSRARGGRTRCRSPRRGRTPSTWPSWRRGCARYRPEELFDEHGTPLPELAACAPDGDARMSANPHANGGQLLRDLRLPDFRATRVAVAEPGACDRGRHGSWARGWPTSSGEPAHLPHRRTGRDRLQPPAGRVRGHGQAFLGAGSSRPTSTSPSPAG